MEWNLRSWNQHIWLKNDDKKWSRIFYFEILCAPSELLLPSAKYLPRKAELAWQVSRYLKGHVGFQNKKKYTYHFSSSFLSQKWLFQELRFWSTYSHRSRRCDNINFSTYFIENNFVSPLNNILMTDTKRQAFHWQLGISLKSTLKNKNFVRTAKS